MRAPFLLIHLFIFTWGTICLNSFRIGLKYNSLGEYTETNIDINSVFYLSVINSLLFITNYKNDILLTVFNTALTISLVIVNIYIYQCCLNECTNFYNGGKFYYYYSLYTVLPYVQLISSLIIVKELSKNNFKINFCIKKIESDNSLEREI
jgi:hypothetical protein